MLIVNFAAMAKVFYYFCKGESFAEMLQPFGCGDDVFYVFETRQDCFAEKVDTGFSCVQCALFDLCSKLVGDLNGGHREPLFGGM